MTQNINNNIEYCEHCGKSIKVGTKFCPYCGGMHDMIVDLEDEHGKQTDQSVVSQDFLNSAENEESAWEEEVSESEKDTQQESPLESIISEDNWWKRSSEGKKIVIVIVGTLLSLFVGFFLIQILKKIGYILFAILVVVSVIYMYVKGTDEEKKDARKVILSTFAGIVAIVMIVIFIVSRPDIANNIVRPGASVRDAYLAQYSDKVTIDKAFAKYFSNEKWDTYDKEGYSYVTFKGTCMFMGKNADVCIIFKITGENFVVDGVDVNGNRQNELISLALLKDIYDNIND